MRQAEGLREQVAGLLEPAPEAGDAAASFPGPEALLELRGKMRVARDRVARLLDPGDPERDELKPPDWDALCTAAAAAIGRHRPNLEVAAWWAEAAAHAEGFAGIAAGATLLAGLMRLRWDDLERRPDPDGLTNELIGPLAPLLSNQLPLIARCVTLFRLEGDKPYTYESYLRGRQRNSSLAEYERLKTTSLPSHIRPEERQRHLDTLAAKKAAIERPEMQPWEVIVAIAAGQEDVLAEHAVALDQAVAAVELLRAAIAERGGEGIASTTSLSELLTSLVKVVGLLRPSAADPLAQAGQPDEAADAEGAMVGGQVRARKDGAMNREAAIATLLEVAAFFRRAEPQSPIGDILEEIARRAGLTWAEFLTEMMPDINQRELLRERLGLPRKPREGQGP